MSTDLMIAKPLTATRPFALNAAASESIVLEPPAKTGPPNESQTASRMQVIARDLLALTKPRIVLMVLVTALVATTIVPNHALNSIALLQLMIAIGLVAGSAGAMNQVWERNIDLQMERTRRRPLPAGRLSPTTAALFSLLLGTVGTIYLAFGFGIVPAVVGVVTWIAYVPLYTPLKTRSAWNTTVGAVSGALPVLIGYTAAGGMLDQVAGWLLFGVLFAWQYPHFMAIAWLYRRQYAEAGFQMTTTVEPTGRDAGMQSVMGMVLLVGCLIGLAVCQWGLSIPTMVLSAVLVGISYPMSRAAMRFAATRDDQTARRLLRASLLQLPGSLLLLSLAALWSR